MRPVPHTSRSGSSPRVRGTLAGHDDPTPRCRLIPAGAGNTAPDTRTRSRQPAHPRGCGEHTEQSGSAYASAGSSPRVRGTQRITACQQSIKRLIPAGAGNTVMMIASVPLAPAHPRGCGEHVGVTPAGYNGTGSSPRVRGTLGFARHGQAPHRLIPAGAGNTPTARKGFALGTAHPRGCGEHIEIGRPVGLGVGSSPRVRGTRIKQSRKIAAHRLIPAGAGNTSSEQQMPLLFAAHPRGCGEHEGRIHRGMHADGSSPRVRGTRRWSKRHQL